MKIAHGVGAGNDRLADETLTIGCHKARTKSVPAAVRVVPLDGLSYSPYFGERFEWAGSYLGPAHSTLLLMLGSKARVGNSLKTSGFRDFNIFTYALWECFPLYGRGVGKVKLIRPSFRVSC